MSVLYLDRRSVGVSAASGRLRIERALDTPPVFVPIADLQHVVVAAEMAIPVRVLAMLGQEGVAVTVVRPRHNADAFAMLGRPHADVGLRLAQYRAVTDADACLRIARAVVAFKRMAQRHALRAMAQQRPDCRLPLRQAWRDLSAVALARAGDADAVRGAEGAMARAYYGGLRAVLPESLGFRSRLRRPAPDPVNAALSLAYSLLHGRAAQAAWSAGLDPMLGFLHAPTRGRDSLACDLAEPLRPAVDLMVWRLFAEKTLRAEHFRHQRGACQLDKAGRALFYPVFEHHARHWQVVLRGYARRLRHHLCPRPEA